MVSILKSRGNNIVSGGEINAHATNQVIKHQGDYCWDIFMINIFDPKYCTRKGNKIGILYTIQMTREEAETIRKHLNYMLDTVQP